MSLEKQIEGLLAKGESAENIAEALEVDRRLVEIVARRDKGEEREDISEEDFDVIRRRLMEIAKESPDDYLAAKVGMFLWEQKRGRAKDKSRELGDIITAVTIEQINLLLKDANTRAVKALTGDAGGIEGDSGEGQREATYQGEESAAGPANSPPAGNPNSSSRD